MSDKQSKTNPFAQIEKQVNQFWQNNKIFQKSVERPAKAGSYVFYDGPPFATGTPHYGHIVASLIKDAVPRWWTMNGYKVERVWGWDCHGLPIENIVEKELKFKSKKDIEAYGVDKFNAKCRERVLSYAAEWEKTINRLGRWVDFEHAYKTMDLDYMESVWWAFKQLWDKQLIYESYRSLHICPRCQTTLSQSEVAEGYREVKDLSAIVKFKLLPNQPIGNFITDDQTYILAWTTTPWTLLGNVGLAVGKEIDYIVIASPEGAKQSIIIAKERVADILKNQEYKIIKEFKGAELVGKKYQPLFDYYVQDTKLENRDNGWKIYNADFVNTEEGTGVVHLAPAFGEDDMNLSKQENLPFVQHVNLDGTIKPEAIDFAGLEVKPLNDPQSTDKKIVEFLQKQNAIFAIEQYQHDYPHCWRCDTPLLNYAAHSWFVDVVKIKTQLRPNLLETAAAISWSPNYIKDGRFGDWLQNARDWSISRQRFWASCIPVWQCGACGHQQAFGSIAELEQASGQSINDLHKDRMDKINLKCEAKDCGSAMKRVPDVLDCWFESGSMPYAQLHYPFDNKTKLEENFPARFIAEGVDQTRAWFYYLHLLACALRGNAAFQNVIVNGIVLAEDGKKMSKKLNNYPDPNEVMEQYGADALRWYLLSSPVMAAENLNFSVKGVQEALRKNLMILDNVYKFYELYAKPVHSEIETRKILPSFNLVNLDNLGNLETFFVLDQWIVARLHSLIALVSEQMQNYNLQKSIRPISEFIDELSTWYLRRSRARFKAVETDALNTLKYVLTELSKLIAPFAPFYAERLWQQISGYNFVEANQSVHLQDWPQGGEIKATVLEAMHLVRQIVAQALRQRDEHKLKVRQILSKLTISGQGLTILTEAYQQIIANEVNVKQVELRPSNEALQVVLDVALTPELLNEGAKRELIRLINAWRKEIGLTIKDKIVVQISDANEATKKLLDSWQSELLAATLAAGLEFDKTDSAAAKLITINGQTLAVGIIKN